MNKRSTTLASAIDPLNKRFTILKGDDTLGLSGPLTTDPAAGRPRSPVARRRIGGGNITAGGFTVPGVLPGPGRATPRAPKGLGTAGKAAWSLTWKSARWLSEENARLLVELIAHTADDLANVRAVLDREGLDDQRAIYHEHGPVIEGERRVSAHPLTVTLNNLSKLMESLLLKAGLEPAQRIRLGAGR